MYTFQKIADVPEGLTIVRIIIMDSSGRIFIQAKNADGAGEIYELVQTP